MKMKKTIALTLFTVVSVMTCMAQNGAFSKGDKLLNIGIGVNSYYSGGIPFGASFEVGITDDISVGGNVDYLHTDYGYAGSNLKFTAIYIGARGAYHFNNLLEINNEKVDLYGGATLGYRSFSWNDGDYDFGNKYGSGVFLGAFIGGKYYFTNSLGAFVELGAIGSTNARLGLAIKF